MDLGLRVYLWGLVPALLALVQEEVARHVDVVLPVRGLGHEGGAPAVAEGHLRQNPR